MKTLTRRVSPLSFHIGSCALSAALLMGLPAQSQAFALQTDTPDLSVRWDNTLKYSNSWRVKALDRNVAVGPGTSNPNANLDDGDRNFSRGLISNRLDLLSEMDIKYQDVGARVSAAAWYDSVYNSHNDNHSPDTANSVSVEHNEFTNDTKDIHGRNAEIMDAFVYGSRQLGSTSLSGRLGQFSQIYGESLFFGGNGIANAQSTVDLVKLQSVPGSQFKEILMPTKQIAGTWQLSDTISVGAYYQFEWRKTRLPAAGSYFSVADFVGEGGERVFFPTGDLLHGKDKEAKNTGQFGGQLKFSIDDWEFGLYAAKYHEKTPVFYFRPAALVPGGDDSFINVYPEDVKVYGVSFSTLVGEANIAGETSIRVDTPLAGVGGTIITGMDSNNSSNPAYPLGNSWHAQVSMVNVFGGTALWDGASFIGELAFNRRLSVKKNADQLDPNTTRDAFALRFTFEPQYFQVIPGVDVQTPITLGYNPAGRSSVTPQVFGPEHGGDLTLGIKADYQKQWYASLTYTNYFGPGGPIIDSAARYTYQQTLKDRDFVAFSVQRTF